MHHGTVKAVEIPQGILGVKEGNHIFPISHMRKYCGGKAGIAPYCIYVCHLCELKSNLQF